MILDGFMLWIGKTLAEIAIVFVILLVFGGLMLYFQWKEEKRKTKHNTGSNQ